MMSEVNVKITSVVDPKTYWAYETDSGERKTKMKMIEKELKTQWPGAEEIRSTKRPHGLPVITMVGGEFCRGQMNMIWREKMNLKANVFLVDYGNTVEVDVKKCARKLQLKDQAAEPHLAFKIILEGLYPVSMDIDWMSGNGCLMPFRKRTWDECAMNLVQHVVKICQGEGKLLDPYIFPTRRVGSLMMMKSGSSTEPGPSKIHLNKLLVKKGFGQHSSMEVEMDLKEVETGLAFGDEATNQSSDDEEEEEGTSVSEYDPQPLLTTHQKMTSLQLYAEEPESAEPSNRLFSVNTASSISSKGLGPWLAQSKRSEAAKSTSSSVTAPGSKIDQALKLRESLRKGREAKREEPQQEQSVEVLDSEEEDLWSQVRVPKKKGEFRVHEMPGGVFVGKHHEDIVANIKSTSGEDLKRKFTNLVCK